MVKVYSISAEGSDCARLQICEVERNGHPINMFVSHEDDLDYCDFVAYDDYRKLEDQLKKDPEELSILQRLKHAESKFGDIEQLRKDVDDNSLYIKAVYSGLRMPKCRAKDA